MTAPAQNGLLGNNMFRQVLVLLPASSHTKALSPVAAASATPGVGLSHRPAPSMEQQTRSVLERLMNSGMSPEAVIAVVQSIASITKLPQQTRTLLSTWVNNQTAAKKVSSAHMAEAQDKLINLADSEEPRQNLLALVTQNLGMMMNPEGYNGPKRPQRPRPPSCPKRPTRGH